MCNLKKRINAIYFLTTNSHIYNEVNVIALKRSQTAIVRHDDGLRFQNIGERGYSTILRTDGCLA